MVARREPDASPRARDRRSRRRTRRSGTPARRALGMRSAGHRRGLAARRSERCAAPGRFASPTGLAYIQEACRWVEQTPWSLGRPGAGADAVRAPAANPDRRSSSAVRQHRSPRPTPPRTKKSSRARMRGSGCCWPPSGRLGTGAIASCRPWPLPTRRIARGLGLAGRAGLVCRARSQRGQRDLGGSRGSAPRPKSARSRRPGARTTGRGRPTPARATPPRCSSFRSKFTGAPRARVSSGAIATASELERRLATETARKAWGAWAGLVLDRALLERRLSSVVAAFHQASETEETRLEERKLDALSEFAAGAGHELNNPLAVIVGPRPASAFAHRRPRNGSLAADHDQPGGSRSSHPPRLDVRGTAARAAAEVLPPVRAASRLGARLAGGMRRARNPLSSEIDESVPAAWTDPDALRHLADILIRNAIQATPSGGKIQVGSRLQKDELLWWFSDSGRGLDAPRPPTCSTRSTAAARPAAAWAGPSRAARIVEMPAAACAGRQTRGREQSSIGPPAGPDNQQTPQRREKSVPADRAARSHDRHTRAMPRVQSHDECG